MMPPELVGRCDCGAVEVTIPGPPDRINACPCEYCRRVGAHWGYFAADAVSVRGATETYFRADRIVAFHRCATCGCLTHWAAPDGRLDRVGIQMANFDHGDLDGAPVVIEP